MKCFIKKERIRWQDIANLKLQKLLYYAQGCFLAVAGAPLFLEDILAWQHGPVVEPVYYQYKGYGSGGIFQKEYIIQ
ncbi:MAG: DUF4065 domain-containing protein [Lachnospiraceae bacterium]|nr:DUF4065 domain-containing protein [Lachnospiraceae bacterium]